MVFTRPKHLTIKLIGFILLILFLIWQNNSIVLTNFEMTNDLIPKSFNGFKIVHLSDLHNKRFGKQQTRLLEQIAKQNPDIIVITGDLVDRRRFDLETALQFIRGAMKIAPVYYVSGNHEAWSGKYNEIIEKLEEAGVVIMDNHQVELMRGECKIKVLGLADPDVLNSSYFEGTNTTVIQEKLTQWSKEDDFKILLCHRPELFELYSYYKMNLIFTGHAHGGQIRIPFIGGLIAPNQGFFPKYTEGSFTQGESTMYVSRGLGNSVFPFRIFNRPQVVVITLKSTVNSI